MLILGSASTSGDIYIDPDAIISIQDNGEGGSLVHLSGGQSIAVDVTPSRIIAQMPNVAISIRVVDRSKSGVVSSEI